MVARLSRIQLRAHYFVDVHALEDVITEGVEATSACAEGFVSWVKEWEAKFHLQAERHIQGMCSRLLSTQIIWVPSQIELRKWPLHHQQLRATTVL